MERLLYNSSDVENEKLMEKSVKVGHCGWLVQGKTGN